MAKVKLPWDEFKSMYRTKRIPIQQHETVNAYELTMPEQGIAWTTYVFKEEDPRYDAVTFADWNTNFAPIVNAPMNPRTEDGRIMTQPVTLDVGLWHWFCGAGDHIGDGKANGEPFMIRAETPQETYGREWCFNDWVALSGGIAKYQGATLGDYCNFTVFCPATVATENNSQTGNCNKISTGQGFNIIIPAMGDGGYDVDLETNANPVPNAEKKGFWDWTWPDIGRGSFIPCNGNGHYDLFDVPIPMIRFIARVPLLGDGRIEFEPQNPHPTSVLPHWKMRCEVTRGNDAGILEMVWHIMAARKVTTG